MVTRVEGVKTLPEVWFQHKTVRNDGAELTLDGQGFRLDAQGYFMVPDAAVADRLERVLRDEVRRLKGPPRRDPPPKRKGASN